MNKLIVALIASAFAFAAQAQNPAPATTDVPAATAPTKTEKKPVKKTTHKKAVKTPAKAASAA